MPVKKRRPSVVDYGDVDMTPIMSVITILIPMLIYAFTFFEIKIQSVAAPRMGQASSAEQDPDKKKPLNLTVIISDKGFMLKMDPSLVTNPERRIEKKTFTNDEGQSYKEYDYPKLHTELVKIKKDFMKETTINIGADFNISWDIIARTIDASRTRLAEDSYTTIKEYSNAKPKVIKKGNTKEEELLFPNVVFVVVD